MRSHRMPRVRHRARSGEPIKRSSWGRRLVGRRTGRRLSPDLPWAVRGPPGPVLIKTGGWRDDTGPMAVTRPMRLTTALVAAGALLAAPALQGSADASTALRTWETGKVKAVADGDTIWVDFAGD